MKFVRYIPIYGYITIQHIDDVKIIIILLKCIWAVNTAFLKWACHRAFTVDSRYVYIFCVISLLIIHMLRAEIKRYSKVTIMKYYKYCFDVVY